MYRKRKWKREYLLGEVKIRPHDSSGWMHAVLMNINKGGIGLYAMKPVKKNDKVAVKISYLEKGRLKDVEEIPGTIRWVQTIGNHYAAGIMFDETVDSEKFPCLSRCLDFVKKK